MGPRIYLKLKPHVKPNTAAMKHGKRYELNESLKIWHLTFSKKKVIKNFLLLYLDC